MKKKLLFAGIILVMLITTVTGCSLAKGGRLSGPVPEKNAVLIQYESQTILKIDKDASHYRVPIYLIPIPEDTQREIWQLCEENNLAYELVLAILQTDTDHNERMDEVKAVIKELAYYRDYWTEQGYSDESVFDLLILSKQRGIEGCEITIRNNKAYDQDDYIQKVTAYKYYLDQTQNTDDALMTKL